MLTIGIIIGFLFAAIAGYLLGSLNTSIIVGKFYKLDVRQHGSKNAGATNTLRVLGKKAALLVAAGDISKGILACLAGMMIYNIFLGNGVSSNPATEIQLYPYFDNLELQGINSGLLISGLFAVIGHNWPVYFGFKGGKGVFTSAAVIFMADWKTGLILLLVFALIVLFTKYVSLGSIVSGFLFPVVEIAYSKNPVLIFFALIIAALIIFRHMSNIKRLVDRTETKLGQKKS